MPRCGFTRWLSTGQQLDARSIRSAPRHFGSQFGNYVVCHLAGLIRNYAFVEWDKATMLGLDGSAYVIKDGTVQIPKRLNLGFQ
jgi:hypothetical protein